MTEELMIDRKLRLDCVDMATRIVGKPVFINDIDGKAVKQQDDIIEVSEKIYNFITNS